MRLKQEDKQYYKKYIWAAEKMGDLTAERELYFDKLIQNSVGKECLQIGVRDQKYAPHFISVDKYDNSPLIDFNYDIHAMPFEDEKFDVVVCRAVLEHVENPYRAVEELRRVMKKGARIWVEIPFNQPYHPSPGDFWRVTPDGMRILMKDFKEELCGHAKIYGSSIYNVIIFQGTKK